MPIEQTPQTIPWDLDTLYEAPGFRWLEADAPVRSLVYTGKPYNGRQSEVFAFYATPGSVAGDAGLDRDLPGVLLVHGGGGTAFIEWAEAWARRGYAALAMDLTGHRPVPTLGRRQTDGSHGLQTLSKDTQRLRLDLHGPDQSHVEKFESIDQPTEQHWPYHAVANAILAHSLIRSFAEVDPDRTAITGISWGGYTTCIAASVDPRFAAAVPVYGCGFLLDGESIQGPRLEALPTALREKWVKRYDPSSHLPNCTVPIFFVSGTNDKPYPLDSYAMTYRLIKGPRNLRIEPHMGHAHPPGWKPAEIGLFIDHHCKGGAPLPVIGKPTAQADAVVAECRAEVALSGAAMHYTTDTGPLCDRKWQKQPANITDSRIESPTPPKDATLYLLSVTDTRGAMVTSEVVFIS